MRSTLRAALGCAALLIGTACSDTEQAAGPAAGSKLFVDSDPRGAVIVLDNQVTARVTPDTLRDLTDDAHDVGARLERGGITYSWTRRVERNQLTGSVLLPLLARCPHLQCLAAASSFRTQGTVRYATNAAATLFFSGSGEGGLLWPATSRNSYAVAGSPVFAAKLAAGQPVALGVYAHNANYPVPYWAGRPPIEASGNTPAPQSIWILPSPDFQRAQTVRGLELTWNVTTRADVPDVLLIRVVFRNISNRESYRAADPLVPAGGLTYEEAYVGFAMDPDIGVPQDDYVTYAPEQSTVFAYDSEFREQAFSPDAESPGLVGLRLLQAAPGSKTVLNAWPIARLSQPLDWFAGNANEWFGWDMLSRTQSILPYSSQDPRIGFVPNTSDDYRMSVSTGPLRLAPGDSTVLHVAVALAAPVSGSYARGILNPPGDPTNPSRTIIQIAARLLEKLRQAETLLP